MRKKINPVEEEKEMNFSVDANPPRYNFIDGQWVKVKPARPGSAKVAVNPAWHTVPLTWFRLEGKPVPSA